VKVSLRARPVTMPGSAIGITTRNETVSRPKKRWRATANEASVPRMRAIPVAAAPTLMEVKKALRAAWSRSASPNQCVVTLSSGHFSVVPPLNA
jgi:hypothetical protein